MIDILLLQSSAACVDCNTTPPEVKTSSVDPLNLSYTFHADKLPHARQIMYQLCDIYDEDVQKIISENDGRVWSVISLYFKIMPIGVSIQVSFCYFSKQS